MGILLQIICYILVHFIYENARRSKTDAPN